MSLAKILWWQINKGVVRDVKYAGANLPPYTRTVMPSSEDLMICEEKLLQILDDRVRRTDLTLQIRQVKQQLEDDPSILAGTVPLSLKIFGEDLPKMIRSARLFSLRAQTEFKTERHPNSLQRVVSLEGDGEIEVKDSSNPLVLSLVSGANLELSKRWASVERNIWHQPRAGNSDWVVLTFHEATEKELIDQYR